MEAKSVPSKNFRIQDSAAPAEAAQPAKQELNPTEAFVESISASVEQEVRDRVRTPSYLDPEEIEEDVEQATKYELEFCRRVITAYEKWSREDKPLVLWDIDDTMGKYVSVKKEGDPNQTEVAFEWRFRVCLHPLMEQLQKRFPNVNNGIISSRVQLDEQLGDPKNLEPVAKYFDTQHLYSSRDVETTEEVKQFFKERDEYPDTDHEQKLTVIRDLQRNGINVKVIDDNQVAETMGDDGVFTWEIMPKV